MKRQKISKEKTIKERKKKIAINYSWGFSLLYIYSQAVWSSLLAIHYTILDFFPLIYVVVHMSLTSQILRLINLDPPLVIPYCLFLLVVCVLCIYAAQGDMYTSSIMYTYMYISYEY